MATFSMTPSVLTPRLPDGLAATECGRLVRDAKQIFTRADDWLHDNADRLDSWQASGYLAELAVIAPGDWRQPAGEPSPDEAAAWCYAVRRLRARAIYHYWVSSAYCLEGLNDFLEDTGLPALSTYSKPTRADLAKGAPPDG